MNCKPGDLAYIVGAADSGNENLGRTLEVRSRHSTHPELGFIWNVRSTSPLRLFDSECREHPPRTDFQCPDAWLRPISGVPVHDEQFEEVTA